MIKKLFAHIASLFLLPALSAYGQPTLNWMGGSDFLSVDSYAGSVTLTDIAKLRISGNGNIVFEDWKLTARIVNYPVESEGRIFPEDKVSFSPTGTSGRLKPGPVPGVDQIGISPFVPFHNGPNEVYLVPGALTPIVNDSPLPNDYFELVMGFNLTVAPGDYLNALQAWIEYPFIIEYTLYDRHHTPVTRLQHTFKIQVTHLGDPFPSEEYSIRVSAGASNGLLEFNTIADYLNGASVTYAGGLSVSATTGYQVTVRSIPARFTSASGNTLPLEVVFLQLAGGPGDTYRRALAMERQTILEGPSTGGETVNFDITYSTEANDPHLSNVAPDNYATTLMYEILPR